MARFGREYSTLYVEVARAYARGGAADAVRDARAGGQAGASDLRTK